MAEKRPISLHVDEPTYREMQEWARREGRPVASLIREAMTEYVARTDPPGRSLLEIQPHDSGRPLGDDPVGERSGIFDQMIGETVGQEIGDSDSLERDR